MGIRGLLNLIKEKNAYDVVDLVQEAQHGDIEILVDSNAFSRFIDEISITKISKDYQNDFLLVPVGEYDIMGQIYYDIHEAFKQVHIHLVWVVDGPKGVDGESSVQKLETWRSRNQESIDHKNKIIQACDEQQKLSNINNCTSIIGLESGLEQLKRANAEVIHLLQGEADDYIAHLYRQRGSYAIFSNDTDYVLFEDCNVIFVSTFSRFYEDNLQKLPFIDHNTPLKVFKTPSSFRCAKTNSSHVIRKMQLKNYDQLVATCVLKGNDYTCDHSQAVAHLLGITKFQTQFPHLERVARYVQLKNVTVHSLLNMPEISEYMRQYPDFKKSVKFSQDFYTLRHVNLNINNSLSVYDASMRVRDLTDFLARNISTGIINRYCYAIHHGYYFESICTEKIPENGVSIMDILGDIRVRIYPYLLKKGKNHVREWKSRTGSFVDIPVAPKDLQADKIKGNPNGLKIFENIWSHCEPGILNYIDQFGQKKGFILYLLRYMYRRNKDDNLHMSLLELSALFVTVFYQYALSENVVLASDIPRESFLRMAICPSPKCLTIVVWFMNLYYTAKYICGGALDLTELFPAPVSIMNGSVLFAFYETLCGKESRVAKLTDAKKSDIRETYKEILGKFHHEYCVLTDM